VAAAVEINLDPTYSDIDHSVRRILEPAGWTYWLWIGVCAFFVAAGVAAWANQIYSGLGVTGLTQPAMWAIYITNFVFWIGITHAGTLVSAILFLCRSRWRTPIFRFAEAMTLMALMTAALFPVIHLGRPWYFYWLLPYPNQRSLQPDFRSPLVWDTFAVGTYLTISFLFLFLGMIPDVANARDASKGWRKIFYTLLAYGWQGTDRQWRNFSMAYLLLAGIVTPVAVSVHSVVGWDFAVAQVPGWHSAIFAPYFVNGAIFSGCSMCITLLIPMRWIMKLEDLVTPWHLDNLGKFILVTSLGMSYWYACESFIVWYTRDPVEMMTFHMRYFGPEGWLFGIMILFNCIIPLLLFSPRIRVKPIALLLIGIGVNIGMWTERFVIVSGSLATEFVPSQWGFYHPSLTEILITVGSFAWFLLLFSLFARFLPVFSMTELKEGIRWLRQGLRDTYRKAA
jgi:Ni/Fe-hydrogenase subunit HybB-like protein